MQQDKNLKILTALRAKNKYHLFLEGREPLEVLVIFCNFHFFFHTLKLVLRGARG